MPQAHHLQFRRVGRWSTADTITSQTPNQFPDSELRGSLIASLDGNSKQRRRHFASLGRNPKQHAAYVGLDQVWSSTAADTALWRWNSPMGSRPMAGSQQPGQRSVPLLKLNRNSRSSGHDLSGHPGHRALGTAIATRLLEQGLEAWNRDPSRLSPS